MTVLANPLSEHPELIVQCCDTQLTLKTPIIMGVLNMTPDSFSDGGQFASLDQAVTKAKRMEQEGATIIDVGGESTRPEAIPVSETEELQRVIPVIAAITQQTGCLVSIDTYKPQVMREAIAAGAKIINDVSALSCEDSRQVAVETGAAVCLMHHQKLHHCEGIQGVIQGLQRAIESSLNAGLEKNQIIVDPGFNFGKTYQQSFHVLNHLQELEQLGYPLLVGLSRKLTRMIAKDYNKRVHGDLALAVYSMLNGAAMIRTHEVKATHDAITLLTQIKEAQ